MSGCSKMMLGHQTPGTDHCHAKAPGKVWEREMGLYAMHKAGGQGQPANAVGLKSHGSQEGRIRDPTEGPRTAR